MPTPAGRPRGPTCSSFVLNPFSPTSGWNRESINALIWNRCKNFASLFSSDGTNKPSDLGYSMLAECSSFYETSFRLRVPIASLTPIVSECRNPREGVEHDLRSAFEPAFAVRQAFTSSYSTHICIDDSKNVCIVPLIIPARSSTSGASTPIARATCESPVQ